MGIPVNNEESVQRCECEARIGAGMFFIEVSSNPKSIEHAKLLAENLLDTICEECVAFRISVVKVDGVVPPPKKLMARV
ncbi:hypothetical protein R6Q57_014812 [Mikania cordata]